MLDKKVLTDAFAGRFFVGIGISAQLVDEIGPQALFVPRPNELYTVKPSRIVHVANARMSSRDVVEPSLRKKACEVNFDKMQSSHASLVHTKDGVLVLQVLAQL